MDFNALLENLKIQRAQVNAAIEAIEPLVDDYQPRRNVQNGRIKPKRSYKRSKASREKQAKKMRAYWAARKKAAKAKAEVKS
jgi:hypothetical protein